MWFCSVKWGLLSNNKLCYTLQVGIFYWFLQLSLNRKSLLVSGFFCSSISTESFLCFHIFLSSLTSFQISTSHLSFCLTFFKYSILFLVPSIAPPPPLSSWRTKIYLHQIIKIFIYSLPKGNTKTNKNTSVSITVINLRQLVMPISYLLLVRTFSRIRIRMTSHRTSHLPARPHHGLTWLAPHHCRVWLGQWQHYWGNRCSLCWAGR